MNQTNLFSKADSIYDQGKFDEAYALFLEAAKAGDTAAMTRVASMLTCGEGVTCNYEEAILWELRAVENGDHTALLNLGITYRMVGDVRNARKYFEESLARGEGAAALDIAKLYLISDKEKSTVIHYLKKALDHENMLDEDLKQAQELLKEIES